MHLHNAHAEYACIFLFVWFFSSTMFLIAEAIGATKPQVDSINGEETLTSLYTRALHDFGKANHMKQIENDSCFQS